MTDAARGQRNAGVGRTVIQIDRISIRADGLPAGEDNILDVSTALIPGSWTEDPGIPALQADLRLLQIEERQPQAIDCS